MMPELNEWDSFYVIVGSVAGALIGLQFVFLALIAERPVPDAADANAAFTSPTVVHFSVVLLLSALLCVPWHGITPVAVLWGLVALFGLVYVLIVVRRMRAQAAYQPEFEDWLFHGVLPLVAYLAVGVSAFVTGSSVRHALFGVGAAALLLLFIGIHNAWDAVVYFALVTRPGIKADKR